MRIAFASDLHGDDAKFRQLLDFARCERAEAVVLGGDIFPRHGPGDDLLSIQRHYAANTLPALLAALLARFPVYVIPGNDDFADAYQDLPKFVGQPDLHLIHGAIAVLPDGTELVGYACVPQTPFGIKDFDRRDLKDDAPRCSPPNAMTSRQGEIIGVSTTDYLAARPSIEEELERLPVPDRPRQAIYVFHSPPYGVDLDRAWNGDGYGSRAIAAFVERRQPAVTLHGHIHEAPACSGSYVAYVGRTMCVNPGQERGRLHAVTFDAGDPIASLSHSVISL